MDSGGADSEVPLDVSLSRGATEYAAVCIDEGQVLALFGGKGRRHLMIDILSQF